MTLKKTLKGPGQLRKNPGKQVFVLIKVLLRGTFLIFDRLIRLFQFNSLTNRIVIKLGDQVKAAPNPIVYQNSLIMRLKSEMPPRCK